MEYLKITNVEIENIDSADYPDFCDAYVSSGDYRGIPMTEKQLEEVNKEFLHELINDKF